MSATISQPYPKGIRVYLYIPIFKMHACISINLKAITMPPFSRHPAFYFLRCYILSLNGSFYSL